MGIRHKKSNQQGFTLVEMIITMAIFTTALTTVANIFLYANRTQRKTQAGQQSQFDARFAMEVMAQQVRRGQIDYAYYGGAIAGNPQTVLALTDSTGAKVQFRRQTVGGVGKVQVSFDNGANWTDLTPPGLSAAVLSFFLSPPSDPFAAVPASHAQPLVTIALSTTSTSAEGLTLPPVFLQTTVVSRQYLR